MSSPPRPIPPPVAELERRIKWSSAAVVVFVASLALLASMAVIAAVTPIHSVDGLPDDPEVRAARAQVASTVRVRADGLRFESALFDPAPAPGLHPAAVHMMAVVADSLLERARARLLTDSRIPALQGHLALAQRRYVEAERRYRGAIDLAAHTSEARLGLGVALALRAEDTRDQRDARALLLQAIAQFAAVRDDAPCRAAALYDRALLLWRVGRRREAEAFTRAYLREDSTSAWSARLREESGR
jgi:Flp pilus assembly protein TadD